MEETTEREESYCITEINARFSFNGFMHEAYGQEAINRSVRGETTGLVGATDPERVRHSTLHCTTLYSDSNVDRAGVIQLI